MHMLTPVRHAKMHILHIYPEQLLGNDCENRKIQKSKNIKTQKFKKMQDSVNIKSFGFLDFGNLGILELFNWNFGV